MDAKTVWSDIRRIRECSPLVHNITNYVVMNTTANALLAAGASPVMAHAVEEVAEMAALAGALVLNIGTLSTPWLDAMFRAGRTARQRGIPVVLDPVGAGATRLRTEAALELLEEVRPTILRGNASEIAALAGADAATRGVDSTLASETAVDAARALAGRWDCVVTVSGPSDFIVSSGALVRVDNGHPMMPRVTGLGCTASALTGAFAAVNASPLQAAVHAMALMGIAGELAARKADGPGSFQVHFLDALYGVGESEVAARAKITLLEGQGAGG